MNTVTCPKFKIIHELTKELANEESLTCLACGTTFKNPYYSNSTNTVSLTKKQKRGIIVFVVIIILYLIGKNDDTSYSSQYIVTKDTYAATDKQTRDDLVSYALNNDIQAVRNLLIQGKAVPLNKGEEVYLVSYRLSYCVVRKKGSSQKLWINNECVKQQSK